MTRSLLVTGALGALLAVSTVFAAREPDLKKDHIIYGDHATYTKKADDKHKLNGHPKSPHKHFVHIKGNKIAGMEVQHVKGHMLKVEQVRLTPKKLKEVLSLDGEEFVAADLFPDDCCWICFGFYDDCCGCWVWFFWPCHCCCC
jgi:hypothetical protein